MMKLKERLISAGANIIIYTDDKKAAEGCADSIILPQGDGDFITPFYNVIISQIFACCLSVTRGLNPDAPRGLKKVTVTK
jgi:glucosamine--fructose-6-phosphate aminotransferase (isomerizing)